MPNAWNKPILSWEVTPTAGNLAVTANASSENLAYSDTVWGWGTDVSGYPATGTLAYTLKTLLEGHAEIGANNVNVEYDFTLPGYPRIALNIVKNGDDASDAIEWTSGATTITPSQFGADGSVDLDISGAAEVDVTLDWNAIGYWAPNCQVYFDRPLTIHHSYGTRAKLNHSKHNRVNWGQVTFRRLRLLTVDAAYMLEEWAENSVFAGFAFRDTDDTNNTFEAVLEAAANDAEFRLWTANGSYRTLIFETEDSINFDDFASEQKEAGSNRHSVDILFAEI